MYPSPSPGQGPGADTALVALNLVAVVLATGGVVDYWRNGSVFAERRARIEDREEWWCRLLACSFCLNGQVAIALTLLCLLPSLVLPWRLGLLAMLPVYALAAMYAAWLINNLRGEAHGYDRGTLALPPPEAEAELESPEGAYRRSYAAGFHSGYNARARGWPETVDTVDTPRTAPTLPRTEEELEAIIDEAVQENSTADYNTGYSAGYSAGHGVGFQEGYNACARGWPKPGQPYTAGDAPGAVPKTPQTPDITPPAP